MKASKFKLYTQYTTDQLRSKLALQFTIEGDPTTVETLIVKSGQDFPWRICFIAVTQVYQLQHGWQQRGTGKKTWYPTKVFPDLHDLYTFMIKRYNKECQIPGLGWTKIDL